MAYQAVVFPELKLKHGITKEAVDPVSITGNGAREIRRRLNRFDRYVWTIPGRSLLEADKDAVYKFLRGVSMGKDSFLYRDPFIPTLTDAILPTVAGAAGTVRAMCLPFDPSTAGTHPIYNPQFGGLTFKRNGSPVTPAQLGVTNGLFLINVTGAISGDSITVSGTPHMTVRFDGTFSERIVAMQLPNVGACGDVYPTVVELGDFRLVEVFEP